MKKWFYRNEPKAIKFASRHRGKVMHDKDFGIYVYVPDENMEARNKQVSPRSRTR